MDDLRTLIGASERGDLEAVRGLLDRQPNLVAARDESGATALHYAAFAGESDIVRLLLERGADVNARDAKFNATPAGWAIEYLREKGALLGIEMNDFAYAIRRGDVEWATRFLHRFPSLREAADSDGKPFKALAEECGNPEIVKLFG